MQNIIEITNGPSREELFDGLRLFSEKRLIPFVIKKDEGERWVAVIINSIQAKDGNSQSWNLTFSIGKQFISQDYFVLKPKKVEEHVVAKKVDFNFFRNLCEENYLVGEFRKDTTVVKVCYSTKTRKGTITVPEVLCNSCDDRMVCTRKERDDTFHCSGYYHDNDE